jgi:hypothetical protein
MHLNFSARHPGASRCWPKGRPGLEIAHPMTNRPDLPVGAEQVTHLQAHGTDSPPLDLDYAKLDGATCTVPM